MKIKRMLAASWVVVAAMAAAALYAWLQLPAGTQLPIHWTAAGEADNYAPKAVALSIGPAMTVLMSLFFAYLPKFEPRRKNLEASGELFIASWLSMLLILSGVQFIMVTQALGMATPVVSVVVILAAVVFILIGNYLGKSKSMFLIGVRTPWTLSSEETWARTNRLFGRIMVAIGALTIISFAAGLESSVVLKGMAAAVIAAALAAVVYFWFSWRREQDRTDAPGTD